MSEPLRIFVGYDPREDDAWLVCRHSLVRHATAELDVRPLRQGALREAGLYRRPADEPAATQFTFTRFLVPHLAGYRGVAVFMDCDFLVLADACELPGYLTPGAAVAVCQHDYVPRAAVKMDGQRQVAYPRKNWSSLMVFDCGHPAVRALTPAYVNAAGPRELHRFAWLRDGEIAPVPLSWNWLDGEYEPGADPPKAVHFTNGGPWFDTYPGGPYAQDWLAVLADVKLPGPVISNAARSANQQLHMDPGFGNTAARHWKTVRRLARHYGVRSVLDYGCGKRLLGRNLGGEFDVREYDPGVPGIDGPPVPADFLVSIDVLEHVEPHLLANVLAHLAALTRTAGFITVSNRPSSRSLPDGRNAHLVVEPAGWWLERLGGVFQVQEHGKVAGDEATWFVVKPPRR